MAEAAARAREATPPALPYARHWIAPADVRAVGEVLASERLTQGPEGPRFERALAGAAGAPHAVAVSSGTAALHLALAALGAGPRDEVIVPSLTFVATANAVLACGATPVFADVDPRSLCLDPASVERHRGPRTRGAIAVHFAGHPADTDALRAVLGAKAFLLEDACHALGAARWGRSVGSLGDAACFSFHPAKLVTSAEGGAVTTASAELAERVGRLREHGVERAPERFRGLGLPPELEAEGRGAWVYEMHEPGLNYRLTDLAAALGRSQLERMGSFLERRREIASAYAEVLADLDTLELPREEPGCVSAWHLYTLRLRMEALAGGRSALYAALHARGIGVQVHYVPVHLQPFYRERLGTCFGDLPATEQHYLRTLSLPLFPAMTDSDVDRVVDVLRDELAKARR